MKLGDMPAMPLTLTDEQILALHADGAHVPFGYARGMTMREAVALTVLQGICANSAMRTYNAEAVEVSFTLAEAWLAEAEKRRGGDA